MSEAFKLKFSLDVAVTIQPRTQACSRYPSDQRRLGTERDPGRIFPTSLTGDVTSEIAEDDWERGWSRSCFELILRMNKLKTIDREAVS